MQLINAPTKIVLPFASGGGKNVIPVSSQIGIVNGAASFTDGFPPLTRTPVASGGVPPFGLDMNGVMFDATALNLWFNAGGSFPYDNAFAINPNVGGYPQGAQVLRSDGTGFWLNTADSNETNPEATSGTYAAQNWVPGFTSGVTQVTMTNANVALTPAQYGKPIIEISGTLTGNLQLVFPNIANDWIVINNTTGAFTITLKTAAGTGVSASGVQQIACDGNNNMYSVTGQSASNPINEIVESLVTSSTTFNAVANAVYYEIEVGGAGGGGSATPGALGGSGGASGDVAFKIVTAATFGASQSITIGTGGIGGAASGSGNGNPGNSGTGSSVGSLCSAGGGGGGQPSNGNSPLAQGGVPAGSVTGDYGSSGQPGENGAGAGGWGGTNNGGGGAGGKSYRGAGGIGGSTSTPQAGGNGTLGGGGGGSSYNGGGPFAGGNGGNGYAKIRAYCSV